MCVFARARAHVRVRAVRGIIPCSHKAGEFRRGGWRGRGRGGWAGKNGGWVWSGGWSRFRVCGLCVWSWMRPAAVGTERDKARIGCHDEGVVTCVALTP